MPELMAPLGSAATGLLDNHLAYCGLATLMLAAPGMALLTAHSAVLAHSSGGTLLASISGSFDEGSGPRGAASFLTLAYSYVPLVWAATLAHHCEALLTEAGLVLQVSSSRK